MEPITTAALISGAGSIASSIMGANSAKKSAKQAALLSYLNTQQQINWERERATHAHQWEMQDLKNAGLNPALTGMGGNGANTSGITPAQPDTSGITSAGQMRMQGINEAINSFINMKRLSNESAINSAEIAKKQAETSKTAEEAGILNKYGKKEAQARITQSLANASLMQGGAKTAHAVGNLATKGSEAFNSATKWSKSIGDKIGDFIGNIASGGDKSKQTFQQRIQKAKMHSAKNAKEAWQNIL